MKRYVIRCSLTLLIALASGCGDSLESGPAGSVCPGCGDGGGETGNLSCSKLVCACTLTSSETIGLDDESHGFSPRATLGYANGHHSAPFLWTPDPSVQAFQASGHGKEPTTLSLDVQIDQFAWLSYTPAPNWPDAQCPSRAVARGTIKLSVEDGSVQADVPFESEELTGSEIILTARPDLRQARGTLEVAPAQPGAHSGQLLLAMRLSQEVVRGELAPELVLTGSRDIPVKPVVGRFPIDDCSMSDTPIRVDEARNELGGKNTLKLLEELNQGLAELGPLQATWLSANHGSLSFAVDPNRDTPSSLCLGRKAHVISQTIEGWSVGAKLTASVTGNQGDVAVTEPARLTVSVDTAGRLVGASLWLESERVEGPTFESRFGISNVPSIATRAFAQLRYLAFFGFESAPASEGQLDVIAFDTRDKLDGSTVEHGWWCSAACQWSNNPWYP